MINGKQRDAIEQCIAILDEWLHTNDIKSPSHFTIIDDYMFSLSKSIDDDLNPNLIGYSLKDILIIIKNLK